MADSDLRLSVLRALSKAKGGLPREKVQTRKWPEAYIQALVADELIAVSQTGNIALTTVGRDHLKRALCTNGDAFLAQHQERVSSKLDDGEDVTLNVAESALSRLFYRKGKNGKRLLNRSQFEAGERLRRDFEASHMSPNMSLTLAPKVDSSRGGHGIASAVDRGLAARKRLEDAMSAVGVELGSLLLDVCCYLKGLECVERERRWPVRSAKVVLGVALNQLARHYGIGEEAVGVRSKRAGSA